MHSKGNYKQGEKTALRLGENNSKLSNRQRINLKNIQAAPAAQFQKNKWPNQKMGQRSKQTFLQSFIFNPMSILTRANRQLNYLNQVCFLLKLSFFPSSLRRCTQKGKLPGRGQQVERKESKHLKSLWSEHVTWADGGGMDCAGFCTYAEPVLFRHSHHLGRFKTLLEMICFGLKAVLDSKAFLTHELAT